MLKVFLLPYYLFNRIKNTFYSLFVKLVVKQYGEQIRVLGYTKLSRNTYLGNNCNFNGMRIQGHGKVIIGDNFHSGNNCRIITDVHNYDNGKSIPYDDSYIVKEVIINNNVWIGNNVLILGGVTIGEGAIVQAGSVVVKNVDKYAIVGGNPATKFKERNIQHYEKLKSEGKFH